MGIGETTSSEIAEDLSRETRELLTRFEARVSAFSMRGDLASLTVPLRPREADALAGRLFGRGDHVATGIDGSMDFDERLQMILFYSNATAYNCTFRVADALSFDLSSAHREAKLAASAAVPLWAEDLSSIISDEPEIDLELEHSMERIPNSFMTLGEIYLGLRACETARVVFLDRPMSGTFSTLSRDARNMLKRGESKLGRWADGCKVSTLDLWLAVNLGSPDLVIPTRSRFLHLAALRELMNGAATADAVAQRLGVSDSAVRKALKWISKLDGAHDGELLANSNGSEVTVRESAARYWERVVTLSTKYAEDVFGRRRHPLALGGEEYLTILEVNSIALFLLEALCARAMEKGVLTIGIAKDTTATDISRAVLPYASSAGFLRLSSPPPKLKNDRAFLAILSAENPSIGTPWRTLSYDSAFSTIVDMEGRLISARKAVSRERLFARSYFQLRSLKTDPSVRSQVFLFDRSYIESHDSGGRRSFKVEERGRETLVGGYFEGEDASDLSNLVLRILSMTDNPEVFEAFGHNQLLYLADKAVKAEVRMLRSSLRGVADLRVGGVSSRRKIFGLVTPYRQQRAEAEHARMRQ